MKIRLLLVVLFSVPLLAQTIVQQSSHVSSGRGPVSDMDLPKPTGKGHILIAMPVQLSPDVKVVSITDNAPGGSNIYKPVPASGSTCNQRSLDIWYCEKCNPGVTELKFHLSGNVMASLNSFMEVAGLGSSAVLDGTGVHLSDGTATSEGVESGAVISTTATDFVIARYFSNPPLPSGVTPAAWAYTRSYVYLLNALAGSYQPTLTGANAASTFCMSMAAFKVGATTAGSQQRRPLLETRVR